MDAPKENIIPAVDQKKNAAEIKEISERFENKSLRPSEINEAESILKDLLYIQQVTYNNLITARQTGNAEKIKRAAERLLTIEDEIKECVEAILVFTNTNKAMMQNLLDSDEHTVN